MSDYKIVITDFIKDELEPEKKVLNGIAGITALDAQSEDQLMGKIEDADAIILYHCLSLTQQTLSRLEKCKLIVRGGVGVDNVDLPFARQLGIPVANVPDYGSEDVADSAVGLMLSLVRGTNYLNSRLRAGIGEWSYTQVQPLHRVRGSRLGIIGLGRIGTAMALRAKSLGMDVCYYDPYKPDGYDKALGIARVETLEELLKSSRVVSLHCPLTDETRHMINRESLELLPSGSCLVNTARGALVDTAAIPGALESGRLAGAGIDVLEQEPPLGEEIVRAWRDPAHPAHHRLILNPHSAFYSEEGLAEIRLRSAQACKRVFEGKPPVNLVN